MDYVPFAGMKVECIRDFEPIRHLREFDVDLPSLPEVGDVFTVLDVQVAVDDLRSLMIRLVELRLPEVEVDVGDQVGYWELAFDASFFRPLADKERLEIEAFEAA